ncbi:MAG: CinA family protein [Actinomycetota bacterium]
MNPGKDKSTGAIAREMTARGQTLAVAESCTGGMLGAAITETPGASEFFRGAVIAYHDDVKRQLLKVRREALEEVGAVSEPVAQQMALGVRAALDADYGIGITGIAGPGGASTEKPVGLVFICVSSEAGDIVCKYNFAGDRDAVRQQAVATALELMQEKLAADNSTV